MKQSTLTHEERCWIVRRRLNEDSLKVKLTKASFKEFVLDCMDVLEGSINTLTQKEYERVVSFRRLPHPVTREYPEGTRCHAGSDGECNWKSCPQLRDDEPGRSGRHCPLDNREDPE